MKTQLTNRLASDQKTLAERKWKEGFKPRYPQKPCDHGLFSDDAAQLDLIDWSERFPKETSLETAIRQSTICLCGHQKEIGKIRCLSCQPTNGE